MTEPLEKDIQSSICEYLEIKKYFFWRANTTAIFDPTKKVFRSMPKYAKSGVPDIIIVSSGKFIGLEVKRKGTYQSAKQKEFETDVKKAGGDYFVVRSIDDVQKIGL